jgi:hypothetical protein
MAVQRLQDGEVQQWDDQKVVDQHEVLARQAFMTFEDDTMSDKDTRHKNLVTVTADLFRRLDAVGRDS